MFLKHRKIDRYIFVFVIHALCALLTMYGVFLNAQVAAKKEGAPRRKDSPKPPEPHAFAGEVYTHSV